MITSLNQLTKEGDRWFYHLKNYAPVLRRQKMAIPVGWEKNSEFRIQNSEGWDPILRLHTDRKSHKVLVLAQFVDFPIQNLKLPKLVSVLPDLGEKLQWLTGF